MYSERLHVEGMYVHVLSSIVSNYIEIERRCIKIELILSEILSVIINNYLM